MKGLDRPDGVVEVRMKGSTKEGADLTAFWDRHSGEMTNTAPAASRAIIDRIAESTVIVPLRVLPSPASKSIHPSLNPSNIRTRGSGSSFLAIHIASIASKTLCPNHRVNHLARLTPTPAAKTRTAV